ncbi:MAG: hypothetical protein IT159_00150 [Bryobacterales bacterium]|nr:hypothetical protein [Bryobacterales bacterium]
MVLLLLGASVSLLSQVPLDEAGKEGVLQVLIVDSFGKPLQGTFAVSVREVVNGVPGKEVRIAPKVTLGYGTYTLTVRGSPAYPVDKKITIDRRYQLVVVPLFLAPIESPWEGNTVRGRLPAGSRDRRCTYVRLLSALAETEYAEAAAMESGDFVFQNIKPGRYILVTLGDVGICDVVATDVLPKHEQELTLP